jgi:uncharacterized OB-fold protein
MPNNIKPTGWGITDTAKAKNIRLNMLDKKYIPARSQSKNKTCGKCGNVYLEYRGRCPKCGGV